MSCHPSTRIWEYAANSSGTRRPRDCETSRFEESKEAVRLRETEGPLLGPKRGVRRDQAYMLHASSRPLVDTPAMGMGRRQIKVSYYEPQTIPTRTVKSMPTTRGLCTSHGKRKFSTLSARSSPEAFPSSPTKPREE